MYIIDFDDTLFDTNRYKHARIEALKPCGVSEEQFWKTYYQARNNDHGAFTYCDELHARMLSLIGFDEKVVLEALRTTSSERSLPNFLLPGALEFIEKLKSHGKTMVLLSLGDPTGQELKTVHSGVHQYFDRTFMVAESKIEILQELFEHTHPTEAWFINDKVGETQECHKAFPDMRVVLRQSPKFEETEYSESGMDYYKTLEEIYEHITQ